MVRVVVPDIDTARVLSDIDCAAFGRDSATWSAGEIVRLGTPPGGAILTDDIIASALMIITFAADEAEIVTLGVIPSARRRGLARKLLDAGIAVARDRGAARIFLEVASDNDAATALYAAAGFTPIGRRKGYYRRPSGGRIDALLMGRDL